MKNKLLIYGAGGHGKVVLDIVEQEDRYNIAGFIDDNPAKQGKNFCGYPVLGDFNFLNKTARNYQLILAVGDKRTRSRLWSRLKKLGYKLASAVHPSAQVGRDVSIGPGSVLMANTVVNPGTKVGVNVIINTGATIDHDCLIQDYVNIAPGAHLAGNVQVGEFSHIGIGASVIQGIKIGKNTIIGAGAAVIRDIPSDVIAVGVPAEVIKRHREHSSSGRKDFTDPEPK